MKDITKIKLCLHSILRGQCYINMEGWGFITYILLTLMVIVHIQGMLQFFIQIKICIGTMKNNLYKLDSTLEKYILYSG